MTHVAYWHIASFRCPAEFGRYRGQADIGQAAPIRPRFMNARLDRAAMQLLRSVEMRVEGGRDAADLLPWTPDYRWLLDREDSPWYPTMRLFRQTQHATTPACLTGCEANCLS